MDGWINLYKPRNISSAFAVAKVKKIFSNSKIGHAGTLDPEAEGVLPIAIGSATKLMQVMVDREKEYIFTIKFGVKTDTGDIEGRVIEESSNIPSENQCKNVVTKFIGEITQIPHKYSAIKINGVRAYKIARSGKDFEMQKRNLYVYSLECINYDYKNNSASYKLLCSKGTYVRSLAEDIASAMQTVGCVIELKRTRVGDFHAGNAVHLDLLNNTESILEPEYVLKNVDMLNVDDVIAKKILYGQNVYFDFFEKKMVWINYNEKVLAIGSIENGGLFKSFRVFSNYISLITRIDASN